MLKQFCLLLLLFVLPFTSIAQTVGPNRLTSAVNSSTATGAAASLDAIKESFFSELQEHRYRPQRQSFIFQTMSGETLLEQNADRVSDPASVIKTATTLAALSRLGTDYRFATKVFTNGTFDSATGTIKGDLILTGDGDPSFYYENAFLIGGALLQHGIRRIDGDLVVNGDFYLNFNSVSLHSAERFRAVLDPKLWDISIQNAWNGYLLRGALGQSDKSELALGRTQSSRSLPELVNTAPDGIEITGGVRVGSVGAAKLLLTHLSNPLIAILKEQNKYSNNEMAEMIGHKLGDPPAIESFLVKELKLNPAQVHIGSASGVRDTFLTPRDMLVIYRRLLALLAEHHLRLEDVMPVVGRDEGTLSDRLTPGLAASLTGKTGTLTQSGVSALAGVIYTAAKGPVLFTIVDEGGSVQRFRVAQDHFIANLIDYYGGAIPVQYAPTATFNHTANCLLTWNAS